MVNWPLNYIPAAMNRTVPVIVIPLVITLSIYLLMEQDNHTSTTAITSGPCLSPPLNGDHEMVWIEGGSFSMGSDSFYPEESPPVETVVAGFLIDRHEVTNRQFGRFVAATGYITVAERQPLPEDLPQFPPDRLTPGSVVFIDPMAAIPGGDITQWWQFIEGADWRHPEGPASSITGRDDYPVVHLAYEDAVAYAQWLGHQLPTEAQWEYAALAGAKSTPLHAGEPANTWQGIFPLRNTKQDGYTATAPVGCYPPNGYGLYDMIGNVWEWVSDWYYPGHRFSAAGYEQGYDPRQPGVPVKVIKGGSYLCAQNYCMRYRPSARQPQEATLGAAHIGFRTVVNIEPAAESEQQR